MSEKEFERADQEAMALVNRSATPEAKACAEELAVSLRTQTQEEIAEVEAKKRHQEAVEEGERLMREYRRKKKIRTTICVAACVVIAAILMVARFVPSFVVWIVNIGILSCGIVAAINIDRYCRG